MLRAPSGCPQSPHLVRYVDAGSGLTGSFERPLQIG